MWANLILAITGPVVTRVLTTLGLGIVSFVGLTSVLNLVFNTLQSNFNSMPVAAGQLLFISGVPQGIAIVLSALAARIGFMQLKKIQLL